MNPKDKEQKNEIEILNKLNNLENKILDFIKVKLKINITGKEIKLDLSNKNIGNIELNLLSGIQFDNLEDLNLSHNNITDINILKEFNLSKIKRLDLSFNKINKIDLRFNKINNIKSINSLNNDITNGNLNKNFISQNKNKDKKKRYFNSFIR